MRLQDSMVRVAYSLGSLLTLSRVSSSKGVNPTFRCRCGDSLRAGATSLDCVKRAHSLRLQPTLGGLPSLEIPTLTSAGAGMGTACGRAGATSWTA